MCVLLKPYLPSNAKDNPLVFLDIACVCQTDPVKKQEGIKSLAGFLHHSQAMWILWGSEYFTRCWCVYELACFYHFCPGRPVKLLLLRVTAAVAVSFLFVFAIWLHFWYQITLSNDAGRSFLQQLLVPVALMGLGMPGLLFKLTARLREKLEIKTQLHHFNCRSAECFLEADKDFIMNSIRDLYGSEDSFNNFVRTVVRNDMFSRVLDPSVAYTPMLVVSVPLVCVAFDLILASSRADQPHSRDFFFLLLSFRHGRLSRSSPRSADFLARGKARIAESIAF